MTRYVYNLMTLHVAPTIIGYRKIGCLLIPKGPLVELNRIYNNLHVFNKGCVKVGVSLGFYFLFFSNHPYGLIEVVLRALILNSCIMRVF